MMSPEKILIHIDNIIQEKIKDGWRWTSIIYDLEKKAEKFKKRDGFIPVSERYLVNNWDKIEWKKRMTTMYVIQCIRRIRDLKWIEKNHYRFPQYGNVGMLKLLKIKDKARYNIESKID